MASATAIWINVYKKKVVLSFYIDRNLFAISAVLLWVWVSESDASHMFRPLGLKSASFGLQSWLNKNHFLNSDTTR